MDIPTLLVASTALSLSAGVVMIVAQATRKTHAGFGWWTAGVLSSAAGSALFLPTVMVPGVANAVLRNGLIVAGLALVRRGVVIFRGGRPRGALEAAAFIGFILLLGHFSLTGQLTARIVVVSLYAGVLAGSIVATTLRDRPAHFGANDVLLASSMGLFAGLCVARSAVGMTGDVAGQIASGAGVQGTFFLVQVLTIQVATLALLGMNSQRLEHELRVGEQRLREGEAAILRAKEFAERLIENANVLVLGLDFEGRVVVFNAAAEQATGFGRHEVLGQDWFRKVVAPRPGDERPGPFEAAIRAGVVPRQGESTVLTRAGDRRRIAWWNTALQDPDGRPICLSLGVDVTAQRDAERALTEHRAGLEELVCARTRELASALEALRDASGEQQAVFDAAGVGIVLSRDRVIRRCNRTMEQLFGYGPGELSGADTRVLYPGDDPHQDVGRRFLAAVTTEGIHREEIELVRKDGTRFWCRVMARALDPDDPGKGFAGTFEDISAERAAIAEIERARALAEDAARTKADFLANMSHEIRTPMNSVMGMTHLALQADPPPQVREYIGRIQASSRQLLRVINDILDFSKLEAGRLVLESHPFDLDALLDRVSGQLEARARAQGLALRLETDPALPRHLVGDDLRLGQVLLNLGGNAVKFTERGEVSVHARLLSQAGEQLLLRFEVRDTGIGIAPREQETLFEGFRQGDTTATRRFGGAGLGLAISRRLVEAMGGEIGVDSAPACGSRFWFTVRMDLGRARPTRYPVRPDLRGQRVMVVDDNLPARQIIQLLLQQMSFEVTPVDSGLSALSALEAADEAGMPYRLVLIDWMMPDMDGGEVARRIAGLGLQAPPKCILVTGNSGPEVVEAAHEIGISDVVLKPVSASELFEAVMRTLGGGGGPENVPARPGVASAGEPSVAAEPPAATAIAVRDTAPSPPVATGDWQAIRGRLIELLRDDDMDCVPLFDAHEPLTRDALGDGYPAFESAMRAFDFPAALEALGGSAQG